MARRDRLAGVLGAGEHIEGDELGALKGQHAISVAPLPVATPWPHFGQSHSYLL